MLSPINAQKQIREEKLPKKVSCLLVLYKFVVDLLKMFKNARKQIIIAIKEKQSDDHDNDHNVSIE